MIGKKNNNKNFRKRSIGAVEDEETQEQQPQKQKHDDDDDDEHQRRMALEEIKFLQKQRERKSGIPSLPSSKYLSPHSLLLHHTNSSSKDAATCRSITAAHNDGDVPPDTSDKSDLALIKDTFAQETAVMVEDPNMIKYIEQELAKKRGKNAQTPQEQADADLKSADDELYRIPDHLKVKTRNSLETSTQWTTGIAEIQLPIEYKLRNIEETEAAKKLLHEKRLTGRTKSEVNIPSSFSADYFQRGKDYAERLRREQPQVYKDRAQGDGARSRETDTSANTAGQRLAATDEIMLERFRKRERQRVMRR